MKFEEKNHKNFIHILNYSDKEFAEMYLEDEKIKEKGMKFEEKIKRVIEWLQDKKVTGYQIKKETGVGEMSMIALAQGKAKYENISVGTALKMVEYYDKFHRRFE